MNVKNQDVKEFDFAGTTFVRDIESRVFQMIAIRCLSEIEGNIFDDLLGREGMERVKGVHVAQDQKNHSVGLKVEVNITYGICIPDIAEEIQSKIASEIVRLTGLHVSFVHVIFKSIVKAVEDIPELIGT